MPTSGASLISLAINLLVQLAEVAELVDALDLGSSVL
jgi:hypothetical protein